MNKKISPAVIGAFVLGAVALIVIAILVFGSGRLFRQTRDFVLYFDTFGERPAHRRAGKDQGRRDRLGQGHQVTA